jgi:hypothetical protein
MANWMKIGQDVGVGGILGAIDQVIQEHDDKEAKKWIAANSTTAKPVTQYPPFKQIGTYFNYGVPIAAIAAASMGYVNGQLQTELLTAGGALAGRKLAHYIIYKDEVKNPQANRGLAPWQQAPAQARYDITSTNQTLGGTLLT